MDVAAQIRTHDFLLTEAAVIEALEHLSAVRLHPHLMNALLVYDPAGRRQLERLYGGFAQVARTAEVPLLLTTPTWRANRARLRAAGERRDVNADAVAFMQTVRTGCADQAARIAIGGLLGCRNDCYRPAEGLSSAAAEDFHAWQARRLAVAGVDFLLAATLPAVPEATGLARALAATGVPYLLSFVIDRRGRILDGSTLASAFAQIDAAVHPPPLGYMINCAHPSFLNPDALPAAVWQRLVGYQANASTQDHSELDGAGTRQVDDIEDWGRRMAALNRRHGVKILGGCCGTGRDHLRCLVRHIVS
jgi:S-methylmethionine-dependent homocysteine/selenocysteine methylase